MRKLTVILIGLVVILTAFEAIAEESQQGVLISRRVANYLQKKGLEIRAGDIVMRVNNEFVYSLTDMYEVYKSVKNVSTLAWLLIEVEREDDATTLTYKVR